MKPLAVVIEHDGNMRRLLQVLLTRFGYEVDLVATGSDGLLLLESFEYDVTLLDVLLPGIGGEELLAWIAANRPAALGRTIVFTAAPERDVRRVRETFPAACVIRKPFELDEVVESANAACSRPAQPRRDVAAAFSRRSILAGAKAGVVVSTNGNEASLVCKFGYPPGMVESYFPLSLSAAFPICAALRHARPVWFASITAAMAEYPLLQPIWQAHQSRAIAAVPIIRDGQVIGAAGWAFREPRAFGEAETRTLVAIAEAAAEGLPDRGNPPGQSASSRGA